MRDYFVFACFAGLTSLALAQQPTMPTQFGGGRQSGSATSSDSGLKDMFEAKVKAEWEALKHKDKKAYGELLADDGYALQTLNELPEGNVANYTLWGLSVIPVGQDAALVTYEVTMQFPPKAAIRLSRLYISELWMKRAGQWKEVHYQETRVK